MVTKTALWYDTGSVRVISTNGVRPLFIEGRGLILIFPEEEMELAAQVVQELVVIKESERVNMREIKRLMEHLRENGIATFQ